MSDSSRAKPPLVVVERLPPADYAAECAALGRDYGSPAWEARPEVAAIRRAVFSALDALEAGGGLGASLKGKPVLVKPNLVTVYHRMGLVRRSYPESSDPRVLDALVLWLRERSSSITIVESSGRGAPTRGSFRVAGIDRLAKLRGTGLLALDESPVDRYILPKAAVQREILVPRCFSAVVRGEAAYISLPKLKTNLYTGVTLGFKNAMGVIPYNLRQRNHHYEIDRKLVEMLYLFRPDLSLIDGVVGGEGECPAPVDPVDSRLIVAGCHPVETDRVATRLMGFDPASIPLMRIADELGFGSAEPARVLYTGYGTREGQAGPEAFAAFRPADASLVSERVRRRFPSVLTLIGIDRVPPPAELAARVARGEGADPGYVRALEASCRGGCVATTRVAFSMLEAEGQHAKRKVVLILGRGVDLEGRRHWFDAEGRAYDEAAIAALPGRKAAIGSCARGPARVAGRFVPGCMPQPNAPHMVLHELLGLPCSIMSLKNAQLLPLLAATLGQIGARKALLRSGERLDVELMLEDGRVEARPLSPEESERDWLPWPLPSMDRGERRRLLALEDDAALTTFRGILVFPVKERLLWRLTAIVTAAATLGPLLLGLIGALSGRAQFGLGAVAWFGLFAAIEAIHCLELPAALRAIGGWKGRIGATWGKRDKARAALATLLVGFPAWLPHRKAVFG